MNITLPSFLRCIEIGQIRYKFLTNNTPIYRFDRLNQTPKKWGDLALLLDDNDISHQDHATFEVV
jgi:hypothetical protein